MLFFFFFFGGGEEEVGRGMESFWNVAAADPRFDVRQAERSSHGLGQQRTTTTNNNHNK
jgi:hypothetical protein